MELYEEAALYVSKPEFRRWLDNPEEPRDWAGAARFLGLIGADRNVDPAGRLREIRIAVQAALDWCSKQKIDYLIPGRDFSNPILVTDLTNLLDFLLSLSYRFPATFGK
jgi:hypothetical protein